MIRLRVLGGFALDESSGPPAPALPKRRAQAALAVLAVCGDLGCTRERLLALLWPESDEASARHGLRDALHAIRRALGPDAVPSSGSHLRLDSSVVSSDARSFTEALGSGRPADAVGVYGGPLLDGFHVDDAAEFERWLDGERTRLAREYVEALRQLATAAEGAGVWDEAAKWWARAVEHDPPNSHLVLQHVRVLAAMGDRANAIQVLEAHVRRLREEFDLEPDREILATIERIRRGELHALQGADVTLSAAKGTMPGGDVTLSAAKGIMPGNGPLPQGDDVGAPPQVNRTPRWIPWAAGAAAIVLAATFGAGRLLKTRATEAGGSRTAVAVLPFRDLSADSSYAYFAGGLHDELLTQLAKVASLKVIGRTSVLGYEETSKPLRQIGQELAVGSIVEASVQVVGNRLRVAVQLLDPVTQKALWAERYDRALDDAFAVQSDIARQIVAAVGATVTGTEAGAIAAVPTQNAEAYQFYLQGLEYQRRPEFRRENLVIAQQLYERALALDSSFALAHAAISYIHALMYKWGYDQTTTRLALAQREADVALRLAPGLPQAHLAAGVRYHARGIFRLDLANVPGDFRAALDQLNLGLQGAPNDPVLWTWSAFVHCNLGNWDSALAAFEHARRLDPRDEILLEFIGGTYGFLRRHPEAIEADRRALALAPDLNHRRISLGWNYFNWTGTLDTLRTVLRSLPVSNADVGGQRLLLLLWERRPDSLLSLLPLIHPATDTSPEASLQRLEWTARAHSLRGDTAAARVYFDSVVVLLNAEERAHPDERGPHYGLGMALAALGRRAEALREAAWLERFDDYPANRLSRGTGWGRAVIMAQLGETGKALDEIEQLLARPGTFSVHELRLAPEFDSIRDHPRYLALFRKYAKPGT